MGFRWLALRARLSSAIKLTISVNLINSFRRFVFFRFIATVRGKGEPSNQIDYDFELVFRKTQETSYVVQNMLEKWVDGFTVCAWKSMDKGISNFRMKMIGEEFSSTTDE